MIQRSFAGLKFFSPVFSTPCLSSGLVNRSDAWHITVALPAQQRCAQTISANVLKFEKWVKYANEMTDDIIHSTQYYINYINRAILANF